MHGTPAPCKQKEEVPKEFINFRVVWQEEPFNYTNPQILFVEAHNEQDAKKLAKHHVEQKFNILRFDVIEVKECAPLPPGKVLN